MLMLSRIDKKDTAQVAIGLRWMFSCCLNASRHIMVQALAEPVARSTRAALLAFPANL